MKKIIVFFLFFNLSTTLPGQYDFVVKSLLPGIETVPTKEEFILNQATEVVNGQTVIFFELSNSLVDLCYYPKSKGIKCGYLTINDKQFQVKGNYPHQSWGCDLDENSFELAKFNLGNSSYVILTAINWGSGSSTRIVFCHLFDITDKENIQHFPLWSMYGSSHCFGDYNNDGKIDFLQIRYDPEAKDNDVFRLTFSTLTNEKFTKDECKYIIFKRDYVSEGEPKIRPLERNW